MYINQYVKNCTLAERKQIIRDALVKYPSLKFNDEFRDNAVENEFYITTFCETAVRMRKGSKMRISARQVLIRANHIIAGQQAGITPKGVRRDNSGDLAKLAMALFDDELRGAFTVKAK